MARQDVNQFEQELPEPTRDLVAAFQGLKPMLARNGFWSCVYGWLIGLVMMWAAFRDGLVFGIFLHMLHRMEIVTICFLLSF